MGATTSPSATWGPTKWTYFYLYVVLDIFSRYAVGWMVADRENSALAGRLIEETCHKQGVQPQVLTLHSDRGAPMTSKCTAQLLADLGVTRSLSRPQVSDDNPFSEAQFKTLKYHPGFPGRFHDITAAIAFCRTFFPWYNTEHRHGGIAMLTPEETQLSPRELAVRFTDTRGYFVSEASVYRLLKAHDLITSPAFVVIKAADEFRDKTTAPNQLWQTDFTYLKVIGWGWFYLSTILDDYSRYIIAWKLCTNMTADDVTATLKLALEASGCNRANVVHKPRLLSDNGSSYISGDLAEWLEDHGMDHVRGAPYHPQTQGKIERWHQTLKNRILLENYYLPGDLENQISAFVDHYNNQRYHESIGNVTPADAYFGRHTAIIEKRKKIKKLTTPNRRLNHPCLSG